jgi:microcystin degradation protein MlrC
MAMGRTAVFQAGGVEVILTERRVQASDTQLLRSVGIEPTDRLLIALKSSVHCRADFAPIAKGIFEVDAPGLLHPDLTRFAIRRIRRPCFPLDRC